jgi:hypothetical protein
MHSVVMVGPSSVVPGQQGCYGWVPRGNGWPHWESDEKQQRLQAQHDALQAGRRAAPTLTWNLAMFYTGLYRSTAVPNDNNLAVLQVWYKASSCPPADSSSDACGTELQHAEQQQSGGSSGSSCGGVTRHKWQRVGQGPSSSSSSNAGADQPSSTEHYGQCFYVDPNRLGGTAVLYNLGHGAAATLEGHTVRFLRADGTAEPPQFLLQTVRLGDAALQQQDGAALQRQQQEDSFEFVEHLWDYGAVTDDASDPLRITPCLCPVCVDDRAHRRKGRMVVIYREKKA